MSYVSPIKIAEISQMEEGWADKIGKYIAGEVDNLVLESCIKVGCHVNKDELEKALRYDRDQYIKGYEDGKLDASPPWHRVEEKPKDGQRCFVAYKGPVGFIYDYAVFHNDVNKALDDDLYEDGTAGFVCGSEDGFYRTVCDYWMPIEPPKEDE